MFSGRLVANSQGEIAWNEWLLLPEKIAIHLPTQTALVGDLHLGYYRIRSERGDSLPQVTLAEELEPLVRAMKRHGVTNLACAGDLFEKGGNEDLEWEFQNGLADNGIRMIAIVPGNHDRKGSWELSCLPWKADGFALGDWWIYHGDKKMPPRTKEINGHRHPVFALKKGPKHPCFLLSENRITLPAYSNEVAGVSILKDFRGPQWKCIAIGKNGCVDLGTMDEVHKLAHPPRPRRSS